MSRSLRVATLAMLLGGWAFGTPAALARSGTKVVGYHGYRFSVPESWPVFNLAANPRVCVRFNRHAVYLGDPGSEQQCPAHAVGRTEAILVAPLAARGASGASSAEPLPGAGSDRAQPRHGSSAQIVLPAREVVVTATWDRHRGVIEHALGRSAVRRGSSHRGPRAPRGRPLARAASSSPQGVFYTGLGFDPCATPSSHAMSAWGVSPYRAVGVYVGGANMACSQPNLTSAWVHAEEAAGWHLIPTYVGLQAPASSCGCSPIVLSRASAEGTAAANDAMANSRAVGIGPGSPIYFDMEAYSRNSTNTRAVLTFLSAWTVTLHSAGYVSGVYSSGGSGIADLAAAYNSTTYIRPDDIWIADWNGLHTTADPYVPAADWPLHQRIHQDSGGQNVTYGGVTMNIDGDYLDGAIAGSGTTAGPLLPDGTFLQVQGSTAIYRLAGGAPLLVSTWDPFGGPQPVAVLTPSQFGSLAQVPADRTFLVTSTGAIYRIAGGSPILVSSWSVFGGVKPSVTIDQWDIDNITNPAAHLRPTPLDGTVVEGLPSHTFWGFSGGDRGPLSPTSGAITVDDAGLGSYVQVAELSGSAWCVVPGMRHLTIPKARRALRLGHCRLGSVNQPRHVKKRHVLRVKSQSAARGTRHRAGFAVNLTVT